MAADNHGGLHWGDLPGRRDIGQRIDRVEQPRDGFGGEEVLRRVRTWREGYPIAHRKQLPEPDRVQRDETREPGNSEHPTQFPPKNSRCHLRRVPRILDGRRDAAGTAAHGSESIHLVEFR